MKKLTQIVIIATLSVFSFSGCGSNKENIYTISKSIIDKDLSDDVSVHNCYYYEDKNASYITFYSFNHGEDDAVVLLDSNTVYYGSVFSQIKEEDYDKIIEYGDYALYSDQVSSGDEDWIEVNISDE